MQRRSPLFFAILLLATTSYAQTNAQAIRKVDFRNFSYNTCFDEDKKTTRITNGKYARKIKDGDSSYGVYFEVRAVVYGDLDGDGQEEAVVDTICNSGGTGQFTDGLVYRMQNGKPVQIGSVGVGDRADGGLHEVKFVNGQLKVARYGGNSGACCPDYIETYTYKLTGKGLVEAGKPVRSDYVSKDGDYATRRVHFAKGTSATTLKGSTKGQEMYLIGARTGQTMSLKITGDKLQVDLQAPDGAEITQPKVNQDWSAKLPANGDYRLTISPTKGTASFTIEVSIK